MTYSILGGIIALGGGAMVWMNQTAPAAPETLKDAPASIPEAQVAVSTPTPTVKYGPPTLTPEELEKIRRH